MPTKKKPAPLAKFAAPPAGATCVECRMGSSTYIPCGKPAEVVVINRNETYAMCLTDADHNVKNRGARYVTQGEAYELTPIAQQEALPVADFGSAVANKAGPDTETVEALTLNVSRALKLQEMLIPEMEAELTKMRDEFKAITEVTIPNLMNHAQVSGWPYRDRNDGKWNAKLIEDIKASLPKENKQSFIDWLVEIKKDDLVKRKIVIKFGRDQVKLAMKFLRDLAQRKIDLHPEVDEEVNWQTLNSFVKERRQQAIDRGADPDAALPPAVSIFKLRYIKLEKEENKKGVVPID